MEEGVSEPEAEVEKPSWKKNDAKERWILLDFVKDHWIPQISEKKTAKIMFDALKELFENNNVNRALP